MVMCFVPDCKTLQRTKNLQIFHIPCQKRRKESLDITYKVPNLTIILLFDLKSFFSGDKILNFPNWYVAGDLILANKGLLIRVASSRSLFKYTYHHF